MKILSSIWLGLTLLVDASLVPSSPPIAATAYILQDFHSERVLLAKNVDQRLQPASLTKLMTAYLVFEKLRQGQFHLSDLVKISEQAWKMPGSRMYLEVNTQVPVELLLQGMIIQSGNDAAVALAEFSAGSEAAFVKLMNQRAQELGLKNTHYVNSTGWPDETQAQYTTAKDLAYLASLIIRDFPEYYPWYSQREFTYNNITQSNRNLLLWQDPSVDGMKTGYTEGAGYCLVASAKRGEMRLISVVMGTHSGKVRAAESQKMLDYGFRFFETYRLYQAREPLNTERVWQGTQDKLPLGLSVPLYITVPKGQYEQLNATLRINQKYITAPVKAGEKVGTLTISLGHEVVSKQPIIALSSIEVGSPWKKLVDYFLLLLDTKFKS